MNTFLVEDMRVSTPDSRGGKAVRALPASKLPARTPHPLLFNYDNVRRVLQCTIRVNGCRMVQLPDP